MIDEVSGNKLVVHENYILVSESQRPQVEAILKENGCSGEWSPSVGSVQTYSSFNNELGEVAVWSVWLGNIDPANIQSALDKLE